MVGWYDPEGKKRGKSCGPGNQGRRSARRLAEKVAAELATGTYKRNDRKTWAEFRQEYEASVLTGLSVRTQTEVKFALDHFQRIARPGGMLSLNTARIDDYVAARRMESGRTEATRVSPATINKELRHIKATLNVAKEWGHLAEVPKFRMEREPKRLPDYIPPDHI